MLAVMVVVTASGAVFLIAFDPDQKAETQDETATLAGDTSNAHVTPVENREGSTRFNPVDPDEPASTRNWTIEVLTVLRGPEAAGKLEFDRELLPDGSVRTVIVAIELAVHADDRLSGDQPVDWRSFAISGDRNVRYDAIDLRGLPVALDAGIAPGATASGYLGFFIAEDEDNLILEFRPISLTDSADQLFIALSPDAKVSTDIPEIDIDSAAGRNPEDAANVGQWVSNGTIAVRVIETASGDDARRFIVHELRGEPDDFPYDQSYLAVRIEAVNVSRADDFVRVSGRTFSVAGTDAAILDAVSGPPILDARLYPGGQAEGWLIIQLAGDALPTLILLAQEDGQERYLRLQ